MLGIAKAKLASEPSSVRERIRLVHGDMRDFTLDMKFKLAIVTFNSFLELRNQDERSRVFHRIKEHLSPGGLLMIDNLFHGSGALKDWGRSHRDGTIRLRGVFPDPQTEGVAIYFQDSDSFDANAALS